MTVDDVSSIIQRSIKKCGIRYVKYLRDGDSKEFNQVKNMNIYGDEYPIVKLECIVHVMKRMRVVLAN